LRIDQPGEFRAGREGGFPLGRFASGPRVQARNAAALMSQPAATQLAIQAAMTAPISNHFMIVLLTTLAMHVQAIDV
jgi:hypothetical protein